MEKFREQIYAKLNVSDRDDLKRWHADLKRAGKFINWNPLLVLLADWGWVGEVVGGVV